MKCTVVSVDESIIIEKIIEFEPDLIVMSESTFCLLCEAHDDDSKPVIVLKPYRTFKGVPILFNQNLSVGEFKIYKEIG